MIEEFAKEYKSDINCIPSNTNKYMSFSVPIEKEVIKSDDDDDDDVDDDDNKGKKGTYI